jgi:hypothetical protein
LLPLPSPPPQRGDTVTPNYSLRRDMAGACADVARLPGLPARVQTSDPLNLAGTLLDCSSCVACCNLWVMNACRQGADVACSVHSYIQSGELLTLEKLQAEDTGALQGEHG